MYVCRRLYAVRCWYREVFKTILDEEKLGTAEVSDVLVGAFAPSTRAGRSLL
jgi:hypothetical protein